MGKRAKPIMGVDAPGPKPTAVGVWLALRYFGLPLLAVLFALDVVIWLISEMFWAVCIGLWCWF